MRSIGRRLIPLSLLLLACAPASQPSASAPAAPGPAVAPANAPAATQPTWQVEWDRTLAAARQEGRVVVHGPPGDIVRRGMTEGFRKAFPDIGLEWLGGRGGEAAAKMEAERRAGIYSVDAFLGGTTTALTQLKPMGAVEPIKPALLLPEVTDGSKWLGNRLDFSDRDEQNIVFVTIPKINLLYDPRTVRPEEIDELQELLDPKWKGRLVINDPTVPGAGNVLFRWLWAVLGPDQTPGYVRALREQADAVDRDERRQVEWIARGRYAILVGPSDGVLHQLREQGMNVGTIVDFKGHGTAITPSFGTATLVNRAPNPNAARVFVNWLLTKDGQTAYSTSMDQASRRLDVATDHLPVEGVLKTDVNYWATYTEDVVNMPPPLAELLKETYAR
jgi:iron(III) transport system substrate-binding protein